MFIDIGDYLINVLEIACVKPYDHKPNLTWILFKSGEGAAVEVDIKTLKEKIAKALRPQYAHEYKNKPLSSNPKEV